jgi:hypothetical protein
MFCEQCGTEIKAGTKFCEGCGSPIAAAPNRSSQAPTVQEANSLDEGQCYYCTKFVPAGAINCPSCGKERKELHDLRLKARNITLGSIFVFIAMFIAAIRDRWLTLFGEIDAVEMVNDPVFWLLLSLMVIGGQGARFLVRRYQRHYAELSGGKKMADWLVRDIRARSSG